MIFCFQHNTIHYRKYYYNIIAALRLTRPAWSACVFHGSTDRPKCESQLLLRSEGIHTNIVSAIDTHIHTQTSATRATTYILQKEGNAHMSHTKQTTMDARMHAGCEDVRRMRADVASTILVKRFRIIRRRNCIKSSN